MLLSALSNAVCLHNASFSIDLIKCFLSSRIVLVYAHIVCLFQIIFSIAHNAYNMLVFLIVCSHCFS